jgi:peptide/nickel transport system substrate-binding protein
VSRRRRAPWHTSRPRRGGGGTLKLLWWQGPTLLNPHFATGTKDQDGSRIFYEPLAAWAPDGALIPILAAEIPTRENGGLSEDGKSVTWKLKQGVTWHDGKPFTADDCVFNWGIWPRSGHRLGYQRHLPRCRGGEGRQPHREGDVQEADAVLGRCLRRQPRLSHPEASVRRICRREIARGAGQSGAVGTGAVSSSSSSSRAIWCAAERNPNYHVSNMPYFDAIEMKGGGDAVSAARAVIQTGEYDYAWNMQVEDSILKRLEDGGRGKVVVFEGGSIEHIQLNNTDPWTEVEGGERSSMKTKHPFLTDPAVRQALNLLVDRQSVQDHIYGRGGVATRNFLNNPPAFRSKNTTFEFNIEKAIKILEDGGWKVGSGGIREKDGKQLKMVYQTSINAPRQKNQAIVKQACQKAGIDLELKSITASVYFSSDVGNPDTYTKFYCDIQMYTTTQPQPDPALFMNQFTTWEISTMENKWQGRNITRWYNEDYDKLYRQAEGELDPVKRAALFIAMNDLVIENVVNIPVIYRPGVAAASNKLHCQPSGWDSSLWNVRSWYRDA